MSERDFEAWNLRLKTAWFKEISLVSFCTHAFTMLSASLLGRVSPSELQRPGMGSGCHGYHPDWPKAWLPVKGPCEYEGGKAPPPPPGIPKPRGGGNSAAFQRTLKDLRTEKQGMSYTCWTRHGSPTILYISLKNWVHDKTVICFMVCIHTIVTKLSTNTY